MKTQVIRIDIPPNINHCFMLVFYCFLYIEVHFLKIKILPNALLQLFNSVYKVCSVCLEYIFNC
jgi:hypothetical protein